jgi:hypothetical protein
MFVAMLVVGLVLFFFGLLAPAFKSYWFFLLAPIGIFLYIFGSVNAIDQNYSSAQRANTADAIAHQKSFLHVCNELDGRTVTVIFVPKDDNYNFLCIKGSSVLYSEHS